MRWAIKHKSCRTLFVTSDEFIANNRRKMGWIVEEVKMTSREQFEKFIMSVAGSVSMQTFKVHDAIYYKDAHIQGMWRAWQASRAAIEIEIPPGVDVGKIVGSDGRIMYWIEEGTVRSIIASEGLKVKK